jgi:hypothetical protein
MMGRHRHRSVTGISPADKGPRPHQPGTPLTTIHTDPRQQLNRPSRTPVHDTNPQVTNRAAHPIPQKGHESIETTRIYLFADLDLKKRALDRTRPLASPPGRYQPPDDILTWLDAL